MALLTVNGAEMPAPTTLKINIFDVSATADRNASGNVVIDRVGTKRKLEMTWAHLTPAQLSLLLTAVILFQFSAAQTINPAVSYMRDVYILVSPPHD